MLKMNSSAYCIKFTSVADVKVFQIKENKKPRVGTIGDRIYIIVKSLNKILINLLEEKKKKKV